MKTGQKMTQKRVELLLAMTGVILLVVWGQLHTYNTERAIPQQAKVVINRVIAPATTPAVTIPQNFQARVLYIDPATGERLSHPLPGQPVIGLGTAEQYRISQDAAELVMTPLPGGGWEMDHQGRFQSLEILRTNPDGTMQRGHLAGSSAIMAEEQPKEQNKEQNNEQ